MNTCKNCNEEIPEKRKYCSLKCRNIYVNKNLRDYTKMNETFKKKTEKLINDYYKNPKKCEYCNSVIEYEKKSQRFCNRSCSASFTNKERNVTWNDKISTGLKKYFEDNGVTRNDKISGIKKHFKSEYSLNPKKCKNCNTDLPYEKRTRIYCGKDCLKEGLKEVKRKNMSEYNKYKLDCRFEFSLKDYPEEFNFLLIEKHGWYSPTNKNNNLGGVSRDHMYSVNEGFKNNIDPKLISHPANCKLMIHSDNISKNKNCSITEEELKERVKKWDKKYKRPCGATG